MFFLVDEIECQCSRVHQPLPFRQKGLAPPQFGGPFRNFNSSSLPLLSSCSLRLRVELNQLKTNPE